MLRTVLHTVSTLTKTCSELCIKRAFGQLVSAKTALLNDYAYLCGNTRILAFTVKSHTRDLAREGKDILTAAT